jgi:hypothetical protein
MKHFKRNEYQLSYKPLDRKNGEWNGVEVIHGVVEYERCERGVRGTAGARGFELAD